MPGGDRTGPMGMGPMTGRAAGHCVGSPTPGYVNNGGMGRGFGGGGGRGYGGGGRGRRNRYYATGLTGWQQAAAAAPVAPDVAAGQFAQAPPVNPAVAPAASNEQELDALRQQAELLGNSLQQIKQRIDELQPQPQTE